MGNSFQVTSRVLLYAPSHRWDSTYHSLCYTSLEALAGTEPGNKYILYIDKLHSSLTEIDLKLNTYLEGMIFHDYGKTDEITESMK